MLRSVGNIKLKTERCFCFDDIAVRHEGWVFHSIVKEAILFPSCTGRCEYVGGNAQLDVQLCKWRILVYHVK